MMKKVIDDKAAALVDAICYWLGYQSKIGREQLIHEASLRYPIADTITSKGIAIKRIVLEKLHPLFKSKKIDLVVYDESVKNVESETDDANLIDVYEFKLAKKETSDQYSTEHQRVFDDVVRLAYYNAFSKKNCYFLMCGRYDDFKTFFVGQSSKPVVLPMSGTKVKLSSASKSMPTAWLNNGLYKDWFDFTVNGEKRHTFNIDPTSTNNWGLKTFKDNYIIRAETGHALTDSINIKTTCLAVTPAGLQDKTHAAGIWKIEGDF